MYGFTLLLPLTVACAVIGYYISQSPQLTDYLANSTYSVLSEMDKGVGPLVRIVVFNLLAYLTLCFSLVAVVRTISTPLPTTLKLHLRALQWLLELVFVAIPSVTLLLLISPILQGNWNNPLLLTIAGVLLTGLAVTMIVTALRRPIELLTSSRSSLSWTDIAALFAVLLAVAVLLVFILYPAGATDLVGMFPIIMLSTALALLALLHFPGYRP